ncbi:MAG: putative baseplate assembly protein [Caldilinea sp.]|nr:putative baseplate assembly protein [Caldilinea sp.]
MMTFFCCEERRRNAVRDPGVALNGIDFLEVDDDPADPVSQRQRTLLVHFVKPIAAGSLTAANVRLEGGERVTAFQITGFAVSDNLLTIELDRAGDFAPYVLRLVASPSASAPPAGYDALLSVVEFSFKVNCPTDYDCAEVGACPPEVRSEPDLNYLARDFNSFRGLMLDHLATLIPAWQEESVADLLQALVDLKAYVADYQSYQQDAVATEAYLDTARRRVSVRRHARLVDYAMHDGCNARTWLHLRVADELDPVEPVPLDARTQVMTRVAGLSRRLADGSPDYAAALNAGPVIFETMHAATLYQGQNEICFYTWGDGDCCLPRGATQATLAGNLTTLREGDVLILEEIRGPETGQAADADPLHRCAVRLVEVAFLQDLLPNPAQDVTLIRWRSEDALPFALTISADVPPDPDLETTCGAAISVARGNIVLADHGLTLPEEDLGQVPEVRFFYARTGRHCEETAPEAVPPRFRPRLANGPLTQAVPYAPLFGVDFDADLQTALDGGLLPRRLDIGIRARRIVVGGLTVVARTADTWAVRGDTVNLVIRHEAGKLNVYDPQPATATLAGDPQRAVPAITLSNQQGGQAPHWLPRRDLLNSSAESREFVAEVESDGIAWLRFGDDHFGKRPNGGTPFWGIYRVGNGLAGNVGADSIFHIVTAQEAIRSVRNPLPAAGGVDPESIAAVRRAAPYAYRQQERAVTAADYAAVAERHPDVQRAAATFRWTGSWTTVFLTVDRKGGRPVDAAFEEHLRGHMEHYRMAGYDLEVDAPTFVPLEVEMDVCVRPDYFRSQVRAALLRAFSSNMLPDGRPGIFHPDNFTFGQTVYLSRLYAVAETIPGVDWVKVTTFQRQDNPASSGLESGKLEMGRLEIARLENDPNFAKHGVLRLTMKGGK